MSPFQKILPFFGIFGIVLVPVGIYFLCKTETNTICPPGAGRIKIIESKAVDYTNCESSLRSPCKDVLINSNETCVCSSTKLDFTLNSTLAGDIILFYQLDAFSESPVYKELNYSQSRDDNQLLGDLSNPPSNSCMPYAYDDDNRPIAPCGAIADAMFTDDVYIVDLNLDRYVPILTYGTVSEADRKNYRNPPHPTDDLASAFQNYSRPKHWIKNIWELDTANSSNNGFQNEFFISWMSNKDPNGPIPAWRVDRNHSEYKDGLPAGDYTLHVSYNYHPQLYMGPRKVLIASTEIVNCNTTINHLDSKISYIIIIIGILFVLISIGTVVHGKKTNWDTGESHIERQKDQRLSQNETSDNNDLNSDDRSAATATLSTTKDG